MFENVYYSSMIKKNIIPLYFWNGYYNERNGGYNFGDLLSKYIVEGLSHKIVKWCSKSSIFKFCAIGSLIKNDSINRGGLFWGTGMHYSKVNKYIAPCVFTAVRGPLTRQSLLDAGYKCPDVYGDPALLMPSLYDRVVTKKYKIGVICHHHHASLVNVSDGVLFIDILREEDGLLALIDEVRSCEMILSSSLHGIIIANAYGIPARYFFMDEKPLHGEPHKKFNDYFLSVGMPIQEPMLIRSGTMIAPDIKLDIDRTVDLKIDLQKLKDAFPYA